jgi:hypothetical protein
MNRTAVLSVTAFVIFCVSVGQFLPLFASHSPTLIYTSGTIKEKVVEPTRIRKHIYICVGLYTNEHADFIASNFDVVITGFDRASTIGKIKELSPNITTLGYKDIMGMQPYHEDWAEVNSHEDWFLHDINGNRLIHNYWGWYAMDVGNNGWRSHYASYVKDKLDTSPFDGVFADDTWHWFPSDRWTVAPSDIPAEIGQRWHSDMVGMISFVKNIIGNKLLIVNTLNDGDYVDACDGKMEEEFVHPNWYALDEFHDEYINWKGKVESLKNISQRGKYYIAQSGTKIPENSTQSDLDKVRDMMIYCLSSYLLGVSGGNATFGFSNNYNIDDYVYYPEFDVSLGSPVNEYYLIGSVYARDFADGKVLVNPTTSIYTVDLDSEYKTLDGQTVFNVTMNAHSGTILLRP